MIHDLDHLASLQRGPERYDYPTHDAYLLAWRTWRAIQRDNRPTQAEADISLAVRIDWVKRRTGQSGT